MELDHRTPKKDGGAHTIDNRVLLCRPCNGYKHDELTVTGLHKRNRREGWLENIDAARAADSRAKAAAHQAQQELAA